MVGEAADNLNGTLDDLDATRNPQNGAAFSSLARESRGLVRVIKWIRLNPLVLQTCGSSAMFFEDLLPSWITSSSSFRLLQCGLF